MTKPYTLSLIETVPLFADLSADDRAALAARLENRAVARGEVLVREGDTADALYIVVSGRFTVTIAGNDRPIAEIGPTQPIGEIAFLTGEQRTATVRALRDSLVLCLDRSAFETVTSKSPRLWQTLAVTLARRVARSNRARAATPDAVPRTIAIIRAGPRPVAESFIGSFARELGKHADTLVLDARRIAQRLPPGTALDSDLATTRLNEAEAEATHIVYVADTDLTPWSDRVIRQADLVLAVGWQAGDARLSPLEVRARELVAERDHRLVLLHATRGPVRGTARWLADRRPALHHHVALDRADDVARLVRFVRGTARGLVASGGGAYTPAHLGVMRALSEAQIAFDIFGGTSGGSAMAATFAMGTAADTVAAGIEDMFVARRAMRRYTWPAYSLVDHRHFDALLQKHYGDGDIEDLWLPYFAASTNLSNNSLYVHRSGPLWRAVRASSAIPVMLPPLFTGDGKMLVDGCLIDNVPVRVMHDIKSGPNVVVAFELPHEDKFDVDYDRLPGRGELVRSLVMPWRRKALPPAPGVGSVLMRSLMTNRHAFDQHLKPADLLLIPPFPKGLSVLDWHRHRDVAAGAHAWASKHLENPSVADHLALRRE